MKKELAALGSAAPLLASLGLAGVAIGGAAVLTLAIINTLNKKGMALTEEDLKAIGNLIDKKLDEKLQPIVKNMATKGYIGRELGKLKELFLGPSVINAVKKDIQPNDRWELLKLNIENNVRRKESLEKDSKEVGELDFIVHAKAQKGKNKTSKLYYIEVKSTFKIKELKKFIKNLSGHKQGFYQIEGTKTRDYEAFLKSITHSRKTSGISEEAWFVFYLGDKKVGLNTSEIKELKKKLQAKEGIKLRIFYVDTTVAKLQEIQIPEDKE